MSTIAENIQGIMTSKDAIKTAIENKGVAVGNAKLSEYAGIIDQIPIASGKWQPHWGGEDILSTCASGEFKCTVRDDRYIAFYIVMPNIGNTYEILANGVSKGIFNRNTYYTFEPTIGGGYADTHNNYSTYNITIRAVVGTIQRIELAMPFNSGVYTINYISGLLYAVNNISGLKIIINNTGSSLFGCLLECIIGKTTTYFTYNCFKNCYKLRKVEGLSIELPLASASLVESFSGCGILDELNINLNKNATGYSYLFYNATSFNAKTIASGIYPNSASFNNSFYRNFELGGLDITAPALINFAGNSFCINSKFLFLRETNFKSLITTGTPIVIDGWVSLNEKACLDFANSLETVTVPQNLSAKNCPGFTTAVKAIVAAKGWTGIYA